MVRVVFLGSFLLSTCCFGQVYGRPPGVKAPGVLAPALHSGIPTGYPYPRRPYNRGYRGAGVYAYPVYVGGGYFGDPGPGPGYGPGYGPGPGYGYGDPSQQPGPPAAPPVVINQYFGAPPAPGPDQQQDDSSVRLYQQQQQPAYAPEPAASATNSYLIAYKDHSVYSALAYWIEGTTLHYVTTENTHNQADLGLIDIEFTKKLNADRSMPFNVPAAK